MYRNFALSLCCKMYHNRWTSRCIISSRDTENVQVCVLQTYALYYKLIQMREMCTMFGLNTNSFCTSSEFKCEKTYAMPYIHNSTGPRFCITNCFICIEMHIILNNQILCTANLHVMEKSVCTVLNATLLYYELCGKVHTMLNNQILCTANLHIMEKACALC